jgi:hypothetical protein
VAAFAVGSIEPVGQPSPSATPSLAASTDEPRPSSTPGPTPIDSPEPTPAPDPRVAIQVGGMPGESGYYIREGTSVQATLHLTTQDLDRSKCQLTQTYAPDDAAAEPWSKSLRPYSAQNVTLTDGWHTFTARCPSVIGMLKASVRAIAMDGRPEACKGFDFSRDAISVSAYEELTAGVVGTWRGCVTTPWTPMYEVTVTFRDDGTYSAVTTEELDGQHMIALYYGTDDDSPLKKYAINDFQDSRLGVGQIDIFFGTDVNRDELRNIRLMGDKLEFEVFHQLQYGPITFQLTRVSPSS